MLLKGSKVSFFKRRKDSNHLEELKKTQETTHLDSEEDPQRQPLPHAQEGPQPQVLSVLAISRSLSLTHKNY